jgi:hypothetical protein
MLKSKDNNSFDIDGIRIYYGEIQEQEDGRICCSHTLFSKTRTNNYFCSDFYLLFESFLLSLDQYYWLVDLECFDFENMDNLEMISIENILSSVNIKNRVYLIDQMIFVKKLASLVKNDWNRLWGIKKYFSSIDEIVNCYINNDLSNNLLSYVDFIFDNYDGAYWSFFSKDASLIEIIRKDLYKRFIENIEIKIIDISFQENLREQQKQWEIYQKYWFNKKILS